jgi:hypothetical protein
MSLKKREYRLTNSAARNLPLEELFQELRDCFAEKSGHQPSEEEATGLREAAEWIKENQAGWRTFERGIEDETWDPVKGARAAFGEL